MSLLALAFILFVLDGQGSMLQKVDAQSNVCTNTKCYISELNYICNLWTMILVFYEQVHIVYLGERQHHDTKMVTDLHHQMLADIVGRYIIVRSKSV